MRTPLSETELHYLKAIYLLQQEGEPVTTRRLAQHLGVRPASVSAMVRHLSEENESGGPYVAHTPYQSIALTARGQEAALELIRHQRLLELFLLETLDMPWDTVHNEAERLAPYISEELEERIAARLGHPTRDPHGAPIPTPEGLVNDTDDVSLGNLEIGAEATIVRVPDQEADLLRYLKTLGIMPRRRITVVAHTPFGDVLTLRVGDALHPLAGAIARRIYVSAASIKR